MSLPFDTSAVAPELWARIIALLEPPDILSLSETCKHLHGLGTDKSLWVREIRAMCLERGLFSPSYPVDVMDIAQLQHAVMGPYLCENLFQAHSASVNDRIEPNLVVPVSEVTLDLDSSRNSRHYLVPGGRFLITAGDCLRVWDLGVPGHGPLAVPLLISSSALETPDQDGDLLDICVYVVEDRSLRIAVMFWSYKTSVYEISLDDEKPALQLLPGMICPGHLPNHQYGWTGDIYGNQALLSTIDNTVIIWDYIMKCYALWTIDITINDWYTCDIAFFGDLLVVIYSDSLKVWLVPTPKRPCNEPITHTAVGPNDLTAPSPPDATINFPAIDVIADRRGAFNCPSDWNPRSGDPLTFDILYVPSQGEATVGISTRYQLAVTIHDDAWPTLISADLQLLETFDFMGRYQYRGYNHTFSRYVSGYSVPITVHEYPYDSRDGAISFFRHSTYPGAKDTVIFGVYSVTPAPLESYDYPADDRPSSTQVGPPRATVRLTHLHSVEKLNEHCTWSLCASSGRLVYLGYQDARRRDMMFIRSYIV